MMGLQKSADVIVDDLISGYQGGSNPNHRRTEPVLAWYFS